MDQERRSFYLVATGFGLFYSLMSLAGVYGLWNPKHMSDVYQFVALTAVTLVLYVVIATLTGRSIRVKQ